MSMRHYHTKGQHYLFVSLPFNKSLEVGVQDVKQYAVQTHFNTTFSVHLRGRDHAGLRFNIRLWRIFFEFNLTDNRHWNYSANRWCTKEES